MDFLEEKSKKILTNPKWYDIIVTVGERNGRKKKRLKKSQNFFKFFSKST